MPWGARPCLGAVSVGVSLFASSCCTVLHGVSSALCGVTLEYQGGCSACGGTPVQAGGLDGHGLGCRREGGLVRGCAQGAGQELSCGAEAAAEHDEPGADEIDQRSQADADDGGGFGDDALAGDVAGPCPADQAGKVLDVQAGLPGVLEQRFAAGVAVQASPVTARAPPALVVDGDVPELGDCPAGACLQVA